ncbi:hypothetical protein JAAARDRAFT_379910 [Jaapia argillacea MUCL 33604]|uniref:Uncharacterized protein n=1 Tax=Jaapia argillacea MUCL 33604 TaxID=933084 RepID=A0A067Q8X1_9AGAM|nr:hypothetical protein JAAARDRAFT_379910 [Jaapia argillacea MUCL 33604]
MTRKFANAVAAVDFPATLLLLLPSEYIGWCEQFSQEGYTVNHIDYPPPDDNVLTDTLSASFSDLGKVECAIITYGLSAEDAKVVHMAASQIVRLKVLVHYCPSAEPKDLLVEGHQGEYLPTIIHLASSQELLHAQILALADSNLASHRLPSSAYTPITTYTYPFVPESPPFPLLKKAPAQVKAGETSATDPYIRSATGVSYTRTLALLRRHLGPHFDLEKLWERHTYFEFVERDAPSLSSSNCKLIKLITK